MQAWFVSSPGSMAELVLYIKPEQHDITILNYIVLSFQAHQTFFFCRRMGTAGHQVVIADNFGFDKSAFKIGMDLSGGLRRLGAIFNGPCTGFGWSGGQIADQAEQTVTGFDKFFQPLWNVHARHSSGPAVKKVCRFNNL